MGNRPQLDVAAVGVGNAAVARLHGMSGRRYRDTNRGVGEVRQVTKRLVEPGLPTEVAPQNADQLQIAALAQFALEIGLRQVRAGAGYQGPDFSGAAGFDRSRLLRSRPRKRSGIRTRRPTANSLCARSRTNADRCESPRTAINGMASAAQRSSAFPAAERNSASGSSATSGKSGDTASGMAILVSAAAESGEFSPNEKMRRRRPTRKACAEGDSGCHRRRKPKRPLPLRRVCIIERSCDSLIDRNEAKQKQRVDAAQRDGRH